MNISNKFPGDADAAGLGATRWEAVSQSMFSQWSEALRSCVTCITRLGPLVKNAASWAPGLSIPFGGKGEVQKWSTVCFSHRNLQTTVPGRIQRVLLFYLSIALIFLSTV